MVELGITHRSLGERGRRTLRKMRKPVVLITGANGEIGHGLVANLAQQRHRGS